MSMFRRVYLVLGGIAAGVALVVATASVFGMAETGAMPIVGVLLGLGLAAFGGAFSSTVTIGHRAAEYEVGI